MSRLEFRLRRGDGVADAAAQGLPGRIVISGGMKAKSRIAVDSWRIALGCRNLHPP